jgi:hypothetical protein
LQSGIVERLCRFAFSLLFNRLIDLACRSRPGSVPDPSVIYNSTKNKKAKETGKINDLDMAAPQRSCGRRVYLLW